MSKRQLIREIRQLNPHAGAALLDQFDDRALRQYLDHLKSGPSRASRTKNETASSFGAEIIRSEQHVWQLA